MKTLPFLFGAFVLSGYIDSLPDTSPPEVRYASGDAAQKLIAEQPRQQVVIGEVKDRPIAVVLVDTGDDPGRALERVSRPLSLECQPVGPDLCCDRESDSLLFRASDRYIDTGETCPDPGADVDLPRPERPESGFARVVRLDKELTADFERETGVDYAQMTMPGPEGELVLVKLYSPNPKPPRCDDTFVDCGHTLSGNIHQFCYRWTPQNWTYIWDEIEGHWCRIPRPCNCAS